MQSKLNKAHRNSPRISFGILALILFWFGGLMVSPAQPTQGVQVPAETVPSAKPAAQVPSAVPPGSQSAAIPPVVAPLASLAPLVWDSELKTLTTKPGQEFAEFTFSVTNVSDGEVTIDRVQTSCGCTVAKMPSTPWHLASHASGELGITVNLAGKAGTFYKSTYVISTNFPIKELKVQITIPEGPEMARAENMRIAMADRQAVFKGDCAKCHSVPTQGKLAKELYTTACAICHDPTTNPRASMVPNLHALNHPTDYNYWKSSIANGKPGTLMPAFAMQQGGPLTDEQIESLARTLEKTFPSNPQLIPQARTNASAAMPASGTPLAPSMPVKN